MGTKGAYRWTNKRYFNKPVVETFNVDQAANGTAIVKFASKSGPLKVSGAYQLTLRLDGLTSVSSATKAASLAKLPPLGPSSLPVNKRRHFFTPFDLMTYGFNPVLPAYPAPGTVWTSDPSSRDFALYGVTGSTRVVGVQKVKVPAGTFQALVVAERRSSRRASRSAAARARAGSPRGKGSSSSSSGTATAADPSSNASADARRRSSRPQPNARPQLDVDGFP